MRRKPDIAVNALSEEHLSRVAQEAFRQQRREQTLEWISTNALSTLRLAWRKSSSGNSRIDGSPGSATPSE
jgi:hypothetical protein